MVVRVQGNVNAARTLDIKGWDMSGWGGEWGKTLEKWPLGGVVDCIFQKKAAEICLSHTIFWILIISHQEVESISPLLELEWVFVTAWTNHRGCDAMWSLWLSHKNAMPLCLSGCSFLWPGHRAARKPIHLTETNGAPQPWLSSLPQAGIRVLVGMSHLEIKSFSPHRSCSSCCPMK